MAKSFAELGIAEDLLKAIERKGYSQPTEIQELVIPEVLKGERDIVAQAKTGTGKTAAFGIPIIQRLEPSTPKTVKVLVLTPTRELALQIAQELESLMGHRKLKVATIYGGQSYERQFTQLSRGVDIVVGTPGRIIDHIGRGTVDLSHVEYLVLDEADRMLDMGFIDDVKEIIRHVPSNRRTMLFSATMPDEVVAIAREFMRDYVHISTVRNELTTENATQVYFEVSEADKLPLLCRIIDSTPEFYGLIFCQTKTEVDELTRKLVELGYNADGLHGDYSQHQRERVLEKFKRRLLRILVTTDVAARGIDIEGLTHVVNYSVPRDPEFYVHRVGRTGRAGRRGVAVTFVTFEDYPHFLRLKRFSKARIVKEEIPQVEHILRTQLGVVVDSVQRLPKVSNEIFREFAMRIIEKFGAVEAVEVLLNEILKDKVDLERYGTVTQKNFTSAGDGTVRLFVALGTSHGHNIRSLLDFIETKTGVEGSSVRNVRMYENYSFLEVSSHDASVILRELNKGRRKGQKPIVDVAKPRESRAEGYTHPNDGRMSVTTQSYGAHGKSDRRGEGQTTTTRVGALRSTEEGQRSTRFGKR